MMKGPNRAWSELITTRYCQRHDIMPWGNLPAEHKFGGWHKFQRCHFKNIEWAPLVQVYPTKRGPPAWGKGPLMMTNPLKAGYIKGKGLRRKGLENFRGERYKCGEEKAFLGRKRSSLDFLGKEGIIHKVRIKESNFNLFIPTTALPTLGPPIVGYSWSMVQINWRIKLGKLHLLGWSTTVYYNSTLIYCIN